MYSNKRLIKEVAHEDQNNGDPVSIAQVHSGQLSSTFVGVNSRSAEQTNRDVHRRVRKRRWRWR